MTDREVRHEGNEAKLRQLRDGYATEGDRRYRALLRNRQLRNVPVTAEQLDEEWPSVIDLSTRQRFATPHTK